jgi:PST family polysaccharide transporter
VYEIKTNNRFSSNLISLYFLQLFNYIAPFLVLPLLTRTIAPEEFSAVMIALAIVQASFVITDYGFSSSAVSDISKRNDKKYVDNKISQIFTAKIPLVLICVGLVLCAPMIDSFTDYYLIFFCGVGAVISQAYQPAWLFHGLQKMRLYTFYIGFTKLLHVGLVYLFVESSGDGYLVLLSWSLSNILGLIVSLLMVSALGYNISFSDFSRGLFELKDNIQFFISRLAVVSYTSGSSILVGANDVSQAAHYVSAEQGYKAGQSISSPVAQAMYPLMANKADWGLFFKTLLIVSFVLGIGGIFVSCFAVTIVDFVFGSGYLSTIPVLQIFMITMLVNFLAVIFGYPACSAINRLDIANKSVVIGALLYFSIAIFLHANELISAISIAALVLVTESFVLIVRCVWVLNVRIKHVGS